jgi:galactonate dehydratase
MTRISRIETFVVPPRWLFVRIETDDGCVGWGEASLEGSPQPVRAVIQQWSEHLLTQDSSRIEDIGYWMNTNTFYRGGPVFASAAAGIDQALWDIAGKQLGVPVHRLLGGAVRDRVQVYAWVGGDRPSEIADQIHERLATGLTAVKMNASGSMSPIARPADIDDVVERAETARHCVGQSGHFAIDFHGRVAYPSAKRLAAALEPFAPMFLEEVLLPEHDIQLARVIDSTSIPVATGERLYNRHDFVASLNAGIAVAQPDLSHARGITEVRKIASLAETYGAYIAPHCPLGPIALASCLQIGFATSNHLIQEHSIGIHYNTTADLLDYVVDASPFDFSDGHIELLQGPGLGVTIDEREVRRVDGSAAWYSPTWRLSNGALAEW